jgi:hypothetical protein
MYIRVAASAVHVMTLHCGGSRRREDGLALLHLLLRKQQAADKQLVMAVQD